MTRNLDDVDPTFVHDLQASDDAVWCVARWLARRGNNVTVRALHVRPTAADLADYADAGDLEIIQRVEVKHRRLAFTSADDFPFPSVIVDSAHTFDRAHPKPWAYVILNEPCTVAAIVLGSTSPHWARVTRVDRGRERTVYECPIARAQFLKVSEP